MIVYSLGYFFRWDDIAFFAVGVPVIALLIALVLSTESPVFLVAQNKVKCTLNKVKIFSSLVIFKQNKIMFPPVFKSNNEFLT